MAAPNTNWVYDKGLVTEKDKIALEKAKRMEKNDLRKGFRWYRVNPRTKILVECDAQGNPTKRGQESIDRYKAL